MIDLPYWTLYEAPPASDKKWAVRVPTPSGRGKTVLFGGRGYEDFTTHHDIERRERYRTRHQHDRLDDPYAPGFWSMWALWGESDDLDEAFADAVSKAKEILGDTAMPRRRHNPVREQFDFTRYENYVAQLSDADLYYALADAMAALKVARTWDDGGAGEAKYLDQISVLRQEQRSRGARHNPRPLREDWLKQAREAGRNDALNFGSNIDERRAYLAQAGWPTLDEADRKAMLRAWEQGAGEVQQGFSRTHRLVGIGRLTITSEAEDVRDAASVEVTKAFADEWDSDLTNRAYLSRDVMAAAEEYRDDSDFYAVTLTHHGREFAKLYP